MLFIVIECKNLTTHKKVNKHPYWLVKNYGLSESI